MKYSILLTSLTVFTFVGCSNSVESVNKTVKINEAPKYQIPKRIEPPKKQAKGSLYSGRNNSFFSDRKELQLGDILYVKIQETTQASTSTDLTQEQEANSRTMGTGLSMQGNEDTPGLLNSIIKGINGILGIGISTGDATTEFTTSASSAINDIFNNNMAVVVTQAYQNGNYFIQGDKQIVIKGQKVTVEISGVMNPRDMDATSTISSNKIANLKTMVYKTGTEADLEEKPWGTKIIDTISPF